MTLTDQIRNQTVQSVETILSNGVNTIEAMQKALQDHFGVTKLSEVENAYEFVVSKPNSKNDTLVAGVQSFMDIVGQTIDDIQTLERFIHLHIPQIEDGNNFGVTVQMTVAKALKECREALTKRLEVVPTYYSSRADAVDKLGLEKTSISTTKTTSSSNSKGGKDGDEAKSSESSVQEQKTVSPGTVDALRAMQVVSVDVQCYFNLRSGLVECLTSYAMILDNFEKNKEKLEAPKGFNGGNSMGMY